MSRIRRAVFLRDARLVIALLVVCCGVSVRHSAAQDAMARVKELYIAASYTEALVALEKVEHASGERTLESAEYRVLCLLALGDLKTARTAIEELFAKHPMYRPDPLLLSPSVQAEYELVRERLFPKIIRSEYAEAKARFDAKEYGDALERFDRVLGLLDDLHNAPALADIRLIALGFRDLARASLAPETALPSRPVHTTGSPLIVIRAAATLAEPQVPIYDASSPDVVPPVPLKPILPPVSTEFSTPTPTSGLFEVLIDEKGQVESVAVQRSINPQYDRFFLREARNWRYRPATRNGQAVKFRKVIEVYTTPLGSTRD